MLQFYRLPIVLLLLDHSTANPLLIPATYSSTVLPLPNTTTITNVATPLSAFQRSIAAGLKIGRDYSPETARLIQISGVTRAPHNPSANPADFQQLSLFMYADDNVHTLKYLVRCSDWEHWNPHVEHSRSHWSQLPDIDWEHVELSLEAADQLVKSAGYTAPWLMGPYEEIFVIRREVPEQGKPPYEQVYYGFKFLRSELEPGERGVAFVGDDDHTVHYVPFTGVDGSEDMWFQGLTGQMGGGGTNLTELTGVGAGVANLTGVETF
ncbi:uncharacterized protein KY384_001296 [Bacidia gigantensis]|uniref:uncharacterized protein n=1 Tax=Bacidia gigantensis TaxID=2732470 RepID=UPI001D055242|nr:uncharacterized protein KY384_001296 [Bacidia gigantensis]KAG8533556.1 hypothetical protein KY384_001296 [Bacidia gigantensis]